MLAGTDWLDPSTVRVQLRLRNTALVGPANLQPISALPALFFRRLRILAGSQTIEDIAYYNRVYYTIDIYFLQNVGSLHAFRNMTIQIKV